MKTIKEWLQQLNEPYRTQALNNTWEKSLEIHTSSLDMALLHAFPFFETPEKSDYWHNIVEEIKKNNRKYFESQS